MPLLLPGPDAWGVGGTGPCDAPGAAASVGSSSGNGRKAMPSHKADQGLAPQAGHPWAPHFSPSRPPDTFHRTVLHWHPLWALGCSVPRGPSLTGVPAIVSLGPAARGRPPSPEARSHPCPPSALASGLSTPLVATAQAQGSPLKPLWSSAPGPHTAPQPSWARRPGPGFLHRHLWSHGVAPLCPRQTSS